MNSDAALLQLETFFSQFPELILPKKRVFVNAYDTVTSIFYLKKGVVKQYSVSDAGQELIVQLYKPGSYFYLTWIRESRYSSYYFETHTAATLVKVPLDQARAFIDSSTEVLRELNIRMFRGVDQVLFRMETLAFGTASTKVAAALVLLARRFGVAVDEKTLIDLPLTHQDIAAMTALTRETVSLEMSKLSKKGVIGRRQGRVIVDATKLSDMVPYTVDR